MVKRDRRILLEAALMRLAPGIPSHEFHEIVGHGMSTKSLYALPAARAAWLACVAYIRHVYTDYDALLEDGYDIAAARHFVTDDINEILESWGAAQRVTQEDEGAEKPPT
jgi:hypothetical protein